MSTSAQTVKVTLTLPKEVYERAAKTAQATERAVWAV